MAKVLCLTADGRLFEQELAAGSLNSINANAIFNFGNEADFVTVNISNTQLTNSNIKGVSFIPIETPETSLDDFKLNDVKFCIENIVDNVSFDLTAIAGGNASGNFTVKYLITY